MDFKMKSAYFAPTTNTLYIPVRYDIHQETIDVMEDIEVIDLIKINDYLMQLDVPLILLVIVG